MSDKAQRVTTTEDNEDQEALTVMASAIGATMILRKSPREIAEAGLSALSEAGYTVVKTEERSEYAVGDLVTDDLGQRWVREADQSWGWINWIDGECVIDNNYLDRIPTRPLNYVTNIGELPVPESDTLGGGDDVA